MSTIIKLIFTALALNACVQLGRSQWGFYEFQDAVQQATLFSGKETPEQLSARVMGIADEQRLPVDPETVHVSYRDTQAAVRASYTDEVALMPGYVYKWQHDLNLDVRRPAY